MLRTFSIFASFLFFSFTSLAQPLNKAKLDSLFDLLDKEHQAMGSFSITQNGETVYKRSIGYSKFSETIKQPSNDQTRYQIGSITKTYTAALIFQLIDEEKLSLDTRLADFYPELPNAKLITIKLLLAHRSGLVDYVNDAEDKSWMTKPQEKQKLLAFIQNGKPHVEPNKQYKYCNSGYLLLTYILEDITKQPYHELLEQRICKPLKLKHTASALSANYTGDVASSYQFQNTWQVLTDFHFPNVIGVGDIQSTPEDMIVFNEGLLNGKLVSKKSLMLMKTEIEPGMGMGLIKIPFGNRYGYGHGGATFGTRSTLMTFEDTKTSFSFCDNGNVYPQNDICIALLSIYFNKPYTLPDFSTPSYVAENLEQYQGTYSCNQLPIKIDVRKNDSALTAQATGQSALTLTPVSLHVFQFKQANIIMEFSPSTHQFILKQNGGTYVFTK